MKRASEPQVAGRWGWCSGELPIETFRGILERFAEAQLKGGAIFKSSISTECVFAHT